MAFEVEVKTITVTAGASGVTQGYTVVRNSSGTYDVAGTNYVLVDGIAQETAAAGVAFQMAVPNGAFVKAAAGGTITDGDLVQTNNAGKIVTHTGAGFNLGRAVGAAVSGDTMTIEFFISGAATAS